jgi:predicted amidohydrolase YtcJ
MTGPPLVLHGGVVWSADSGRTYDAVAMVGGKIVAVGECHGTRAGS